MNCPAHVRMRREERVRQCFGRESYAHRALVSRGQREGLGERRSHGQELQGLPGGADHPRKDTPGKAGGRGQAGNADRNGKSRMWPILEDGCFNRSRPYDYHPALHDEPDVPECTDVSGGIAIHRHQIGQEARCNTAPVVDP